MTRPSSFRPLLRLGTVSALLIVVVVVGLWWHAGGLEDRGDVRASIDRSARAAWTTPTGHLLVAVAPPELVLLAPDGTVAARVEAPAGRLAHVSSAGDVLFHDDGDDPARILSGSTTISAHRIEGDRLVEMWSRGFTATGSEAPLEELAVVAHDRQDRTAIFGCATPDGCWLVGVGPSGEELWRLDADGLRPASPPDRGLGVDPRPWIVPEDALALRSTDPVRARTDRPVLLIDTATGSVAEITSGARVVTGAGFAAVSRQDDDGCGVEVVRDRSVSWRVDAPCGEGGRAPLVEVFGQTVTFAAGDEVVVIDVEREEMGTVIDDRLVRRTGVATVVATDEDGVSLRRVFGDEVLHRLGPDWTVRAVGVDAVVLSRRLGSANPFAPSTTDVLVVDAADGSVCARGRFEGRPGGDVDDGARSFLALTGCAALVEVAGTSHLLAP